MPAYNAESTIAESINSVLLQTFQNWELIIINDGSTDKTLEISRGFASLDARIRILDLAKNTGLSNARNQGAYSANGKYIAFLDSDDLWYPQKLEIQLSYHQKNQNCMISHTDFGIFNEKGKIETPFKFFSLLFIKKRGNLFYQLMYTNSIGILTVIIKRELFYEINGFDMDLWGMEDQDLWLRISSKDVNFYFIEEILASYRVSNNGMMKNILKYKQTYRRFLKKHKKLIWNNKNHELAAAYYYRHFGVLYFEVNKYKLATLYFIKSIKQSFNIFFQFITIPYLLASILNYFFQYLFKKRTK
jgi:teichuronic acid biosynthesis glycosyltransferase TuaG